MAIFQINLGYPELSQLPRNFSSSCFRRECLKMSGTGCFYVLATSIVKALKEVLHMTHLTISHSLDQFTAHLVWRISCLQCIDTVGVGHQKEHLACRKLIRCWCGYLSGARCIFVSDIAVFVLTRDVKLHATVTASCK